MNLRRMVIDGVRLAARQVRRSRAYAWSIRATDAVATGLVARNNTLKQPVRDGSVVLLCPPGGGNIGDQAMFEAYLDQQQGSIIALLQGVNSLSIPARHGGRVRVRYLPSITKRGPVIRLRGAMQFARLLRPASAFHVIGADVMDGRYNVRSSLGRISALKTAAVMGVPAVVLGFSWSDSPEPSAVRALRSLPLAVTLNARDPITAQRLRSLGAANVREVSDLVFSSDRKSEAPEQAGLRAGTFLLINASGLIPFEKIADDYGELFAWARDRALRVVVLPHVIRPGADDLPVCRSMFEQYSGPGDLFIERLLSPDEVRGLTSSAYAVVTGRMHLAIMAMSQGVPALTLATVGKVEGLYELFGAPDLAIHPSSGFARLAVRSLNDRDASCDAVENRLANVRDLSMSNFLPGQAMAARVEESMS